MDLERTTRNVLSARTERRKGVSLFPAAIVIGSDRLLTLTAGPSDTTEERGRRTFWLRLTPCQLWGVFHGFCDRIVFRGISVRLQTIPL
jgi:hypothetical protein